MNLENWQVLVVEDETDSRDMVRELLAYYGANCICTETAEEALRRLEREHPTLIIADLALPGMDGWGLLHALQNRADLDTIPRVAVTAYHSVELAERAVQEGFDAYFAKPLDATSFVSDLQRIVDG